MRKARDSQRSKVYRAERETAMWQPRGGTMSLPEIQRWVDEILTSRWYRGYYLELPVCEPLIPIHPKPNESQVLRRVGSGPEPREHAVHVETGRSPKGGRIFFRIVIQLPQYARHPMMVLHELAHCIQTEEPWHGRQFCRIYLDLVKRWMGPLSAAALRESFRANKVRYTRRRIDQEKLLKAAFEMTRPLAARRAS